MTIEIDENDLHAFLDGQLDPEQEAMVLAWLEANPEERDRLRDFAEQNLLLRIGLAEAKEGADPTRTEDLGRRLQQVLEPRLWTRWTARAAAVLMLVSAGWAANELRHRTDAALPAYVVEATGAHMVFAELPDPPLDMAGAPPSDLARWISTRLGEPVMIPELSPIGLRLVGGRMLTTHDGPLAGLVYEDDEGHRMTLCLSPEDGNQTDDLHMAAIGGMTVGYWSNGRQSFAVVAETTETQLAAIVGQIDPRAKH